MPNTPKDQQEEYERLEDSYFTSERSRKADKIGIVIARDGAPLEGSDIAHRIGGFEDIKKLEDENADDDALVSAILSSKNSKHDNYQDVTKFKKDCNGKIGVQHDPILPGTYNINPVMFDVESAPMLVIEEGEVAVIKAYVGLESQDTTGESFKYGTLVRPGHKGIWTEVLRTGKYALNPRCYDAVIVPTSIITLNWAQTVSVAHKLDARLETIVAKSQEGFEVKIDLQVQIHIPDTKAPRVISAVGTIRNLVDEVLQAAVGNHFRDKLQGMAAVDFIETREKIQVAAFEHIKKALEVYEVETKGVYIQDVIYPEQLTKVLKDRGIADQQIKTYIQQQLAEKERIEMEKTAGEADKQRDLSSSKVQIEIKSNEADARIKEANGEKTYIKETGLAEADVIEAKQVANAKGYLKQVEALGPAKTAIVAIATELAKNNIKIVPDVYVGGGGGAYDALAGLLTGKLQKGSTGTTMAAIAKLLTEADTLPEAEVKEPKNDEKTKKVAEIAKTEVKPKEPVTTVNLYKEAADAVNYYLKSNDLEMDDFSASTRDIAMKLMRYIQATKPESMPQGTRTQIMDLVSSLKNDKIAKEEDLFKNLKSIAQKIGL